jgi:flagellar FliL protein
VADGQKGFPIVFIAIAGVVLLLLAGGVSYLISSHIAGTKSSVDASKYYEPGILYKVGDPRDGLIVNVGGPNGIRYIKTSIVLELRPTKNAKTVEGKGMSHDEVRMSDAVVRVLRSQKLEDFDASKQERLKELIKSEVNTTLGDDKVMRVYVTNFVLQ